MTTTQPPEDLVDEHAELLSLIPWYVKGGLTSEENSMVQRHLAICEICRKEVASCVALIDHFPASAEDWKPSPLHFAGILAQVDKLETAVPKPQPSPFAVAGFLRRIGAWLSLTPGPIRWTLAVETLAVTALTVVLVLPLHSASRLNSVFETLSDAETPAVRHGTSIHLVFADDMTTRELSDLLKQAKVQIRLGPSLVGSYTVEVSREDAELSMAILRAHPKVRLAQPIRDSAPDS